MNAIPQAREQHQHLDPAVLMAGVDACAEGLALVENGRVIYANRAFERNSVSSNLRGRRLVDLLPSGTKYLGSTEPEIGSRGEIEVSVSEFAENQRAFQIISLRRAPRSNSSDVFPWESKKLEAIGRLSAGIAHDLNNTLTGIMLYSDLLIARIETDSDSRHHAQAIHKAGVNGVSLVQQLMSPPDAEMTPVQPLSWNAVVSEMTSLLVRRAGRNIEIETRMSDSLGLVSLDPGKAQRIILNLFINARDAMPSGGKITLSTCNGGFLPRNLDNQPMAEIPCVEFSVTDTGTGMDKKTLERAFRPFFTTKPRSQGNGLGLTTVRSIVKQAGGEIKIASELSKGSRVTIRLPQIEVPVN